MKNYLLLLLLLPVLTQCKKETETYSTDPLSDYLPVQTGKYITYRVDSTVFTNFGTVTSIHSYQEKNLVDQPTTDNEGRTAYRVFRFVRDAAGTGPWTGSGTYYIVPGSKTTEVVENNLRFVKLAAPIKEDDSWKGNQYLPSDPYGANYSFSNDDNMADWDYTYTNINDTANLNGTVLNNVLTVQQADESANVPVTVPGAYGFINYSLEKYARGLGLIYQELTMWEYQPNTGGNGGYRTGFGVKRTLIDHN